MQPTLGEATLVIQDLVWPVALLGILRVSFTCLHVPKVIIDLVKKYTNFLKKGTYFVHVKMIHFIFILKSKMEIRVFEL